MLKGFNDLMVGPHDHDLICIVHSIIRLMEKGAYVHKRPGLLA